MSLYKYVTVDRIDVLQKGQIRFTQPSAFDDPFECKPFILSTTGGLDPSELSEISKPMLPDKRKEIKEKLAAMKSEELARTLRIRIPAEDAQKINQEFQKVADELLDTLSHDNSLRQALESDEALAFHRKTLLTGLSAQIGILSLTERPDNILMWSHYAGHHTGFVIEFDEEHPFFKSHYGTTNGKTPVVLQKVEYSIGRPERPSINLKDLVEGSSWYLVKSEEWKYEDEWRMIRPLAHADVCLQLENKEHVPIRKKEYEENWRNIRFAADAMRPEDGRFIYLFSIPSECIKSITIGCRMSKKNRRKILRLLSRDYSHVKAYAANTDEKLFRLNIAPVES